MGNRPSIQYLTPEFIPQEWEKLPLQHYDRTQQYGNPVTYKNLHTGQLIDEYEVFWPSHQDYQFYLHSYNWRVNQPGIVHSKYIKQTNKREICSQTYSAKVYIQNIKTRLSQIEDIPYPDNLYVIMEALEGFQKLYPHSKYFDVDQSQICVDNDGNVKVWVNANLARNFPENEGYLAVKSKSESDMVEDLVKIVNNNTDSEMEPSPSFKEYFDRVPGVKGFQEAKVLVHSYAKMNKTQIPSRFEAIISIELYKNTSRQSSSVSSRQENDLVYDYPYRQNDESQIHGLRSHPPSSNFINVDDNQNYRHQFVHHPQVMPAERYQSIDGHPHPIYQIQPVYNSNPPLIINGPMHAMPPVQSRSSLTHYSSNPQIIRNGPPISFIPGPQIIQQRGQFIQGGLPIQSNQSFPQSYSFTTFSQQSASQPQLNYAPSQFQQASSIEPRSNASQLQKPKVNEQEIQNYEYQASNQVKSGQNSKRDEVDQNGQKEKLFKEFKDKPSEDEEEQDKYVIRSMPLRSSGINTRIDRPNLLQNQRTIYSHINQGNYDSFGVHTHLNQLKEMNRSGLSSFGNSSNGVGVLRDARDKTHQESPNHQFSANKRVDQERQNKMKFYYSMDEELELDADIAADLAKYFS